MALSAILGLLSGFQAPRAQIELAPIRCIQITELQVGGIFSLVIGDGGIDKQQFVVLLFEEHPHMGHSVLAKKQQITRMQSVAFYR